MFLKERTPNSVDGMTNLADKYLDARGGTICYDLVKPKTNTIPIPPKPRPQAPNQTQGNPQNRKPGCFCAAELTISQKIADRGLVKQLRLRHSHLKVVRREDRPFTGNSNRNSLYSNDRQRDNNRWVNQSYNKKSSDNTEVKQVEGSLCVVPPQLDSWTNLTICTKWTIWTSAVWEIIM